VRRKTINHPSQTTFFSACVCAKGKIISLNIITLRKFNSIHLDLIGKSEKRRQWHTTQKTFHGDTELCDEEKVRNSLPCAFFLCHSCQVKPLQWQKRENLAGEKNYITGENRY
jgi:hypothetical protein